MSLQGFDLDNNPFENDIEFSDYLAMAYAPLLNGSSEFGNWPEGNPFEMQDNQLQEPQQTQMQTFVQEEFRPLQFSIPTNQTQLAPEKKEEQPLIIAEAVKETMPKKRRKKNTQVNIEEESLSGDNTDALKVARPRKRLKNGIPDINTLERTIEEEKTKVEDATSSYNKVKERYEAIEVETKDLTPKERKDKHRELSDVRRKKLNKEYAKKSRANKKLQTCELMLENEQLKLRIQQLEAENSALRNQYAYKMNAQAQNQAPTPMQPMAFQTNQRVMLNQFGALNNHSQEQTNQNPSSYFGKPKF